MKPHVIRLAVLKALAPRPVGSGYSPVEVNGISFDEVQTALRYLEYHGYIDGFELEGLGRRPEVEVSGLTDAGHAYLRALTEEK